MKIFSLSFFFLVSLLAFGNIDNEREINFETQEPKEISLVGELYKCSVTSRGTATTMDGTILTLTITVTGPCDSRLAGRMRDAIATVRAEIAKINL